ncbi:MAG TPA: helix-turn-helix domain-containing protein [Actinophytocola sp.]|uniref:winged helix-turn-helix transcriptional regulator n=1 Tax=Actinophytocola sp. TaxID=1872138 RepID=UPI002DBF3A09|nr:helix-turn-helix domain-containing protein [Actinophytocola sp.]HEU5475586.1 helix-turn-helix domain-containing protein [Actinophytocola sp.]
MLGRTYDQVCSVARTLEIVGERWTFLIIRDALLDVRRFDGFLSRLGIARNVLTDRLNRLVENGILERVAYQERPLRYEYHLTTKGRELAPVIITMMEWGDRHLADEAGPPRIAEHKDCAGHVVAQLACEECARPVPVGEVTTRPARAPLSGVAG